MLKSNEVDSSLTLGTFEFNNGDICALNYSYSSDCGTTNTYPGITITENSDPSLSFDTNLLVDNTEYNICICGSGEQEELCDSFILSYQALFVVVPGTNSPPYFLQAFEDQEIMVGELLIYFLPEFKDDDLADTVSQTVSGLNSEFMSIYEA